MSDGFGALSTLELDMNINVDVKNFPTTSWGEADVNIDFRKEEEGEWVTLSTLGVYFLDTKWGLSSFCGPGGCGSAGNWCPTSNSWCANDGIVVRVAQRDGKGPEGLWGGYTDGPCGADESCMLITTIKPLDNEVDQQIKLKYRLPETKYFSMAYPETISLVPGMQKALQASLTLTPF